ncbi:tRNA (guanine(46)-N(7))-methyltransferase TrmB [Lichenihabitans sp. Uapishka_5]|uniref:tRNA (guanine(46)-N(7))-methyltransferase TrmB n=1 Tax=Lichenihabitans sp. Uapishka_5 TaxID=3037302 RepID=UPI0029E8250B|nr:tRNA (guanine(46)-N(7))-methyltransferase TrmB [Lichenihabitans sp. Uapishka_5]MDX7950683.1 tRNA (guanine(46)-N(7))-methyltransferase TrmB [Lichenihabitans sp. Uapishka_5]
MSGSDSQEAGLPRPGHGGVFGRRMGRPLRLGQTALMQDALPRLELPADGALLLTALFPEAAELRLEIGFGGGEHLADHAARRPHAGFIGCEPFRNGVAKFLEQAEARALTNVRVWSGDAGLVIDRLPEASLAGADLFYPDPWPKRRQRKRRFVSDDTLLRLARVLQPGAALRFATDIDDYAGWTLARVLRSPHYAWVATKADDWRLPWADWPSTRYEAKAIREGRPPAYLTILRTDRPA